MSCHNTSVCPSMSVYVRLCPSMSVYVRLYGITVGLDYLII